MIAHTKGPWRVEEDTTLIWGNCNPDDHSTYGMGYPIAECRTTPTAWKGSAPYADEGEANARLMATAPDLLEFVQQIFNGIDTGNITIDTPADETLANVLSRGRAALSKATGAA